MVVNPRTSPTEGDRLVAEALQEVSNQAGYVFRHERLVNEVPVAQRAPFQLRCMATDGHPFSSLGRIPQSRRCSQVRSLGLAVVLPCLFLRTKART